LPPRRSWPPSISCKARPRNLSISSSKKFTLAFLIVYLVGAILFVAGSEFLVRFVVAPHDDYEAYKTKFRTAEAPIAAFGDSHVANAIASSDAIVNLGFAGETMPLMLAKAHDYARSGRGRRIILQYSPVQFAIYRVNNRQTDIADELLGRSESWLMFMRPHYRGYLLASWTGAIQEPSRIFTIFAKAASKSESGVEPAKAGKFSDLPAAEQRRSAELRVQLQAPLPPGSVVSELLAQFKDDLQKFKAAGIDVCVSRFPLSSPYREAASRVPTFSILTGLVGQLTAQVGVKFIDLSAAMPDGAFGDPDHVGEHARAAATRLVVNGCFGAP
jgi:hypothetical protein